MPTPKKPKPTRHRARATGNRTAPDPAAAALAERKRLNARVRVEKDIVRLAGELRRVMRRADYTLVELGGELMARGSRVQQAAAAEDLVRETSVMDRQPNGGE